MPWLIAAILSANPNLPAAEMAAHKWRPAG